MLGLLCAAGAGAQGSGQEASAAGEAVIVFQMDRPGVPVPTYTFTVHEDGRGVYQATRAATPNEPAPEASPEPLLLRPETTAELFRKVRSTNRLEGGCASKAKHVADMGNKMLRYAGADWAASCRYNYTENKAVAGLAEMFQGMSYTLEAGRNLRREQKFDHLGLDREMTLLAQGVHEGRALEVSNIAPVLRSLVEDPQVLERVRSRAAHLLEQSAPSR